VLRRYVRDESVDLIYLDPPFKSNQDYNVLFAEKDGTGSASQIRAFEDTWEWNLDAERACLSAAAGCHLQAVAKSTRRQSRTNEA
jgi:hypothetical protein